MRCFEGVRVRWSLAWLALITTSRLAAPLPSLAQEPRPGGPRLPGHIYVGANLRTGVGDDDRVRGLIMIDPNTGEWVKVNDEFRDMRVAPGGKALAFTSASGVWTRDVFGLNAPVRITKNRRLPAWSPDGRRLLYSEVVSVSEKEYEYTTWQVDADGTGAVKLPLPKECCIEDWSSGGRWLTATSHRGLFVIRADGTGERLLTPSGHTPRISPDGERVAYLRRGEAEGDVAIVIINHESNSSRDVLLLKSAVANHCWSPDGKWLAIVIYDLVRDEKGGSLPIGEGSDFRIEIIDAEGRNRRRLALPLAAWIGSPDWR